MDLKTISLGASDSLRAVDFLVPLLMPRWVRDRTLVHVIDSNHEAMSSSQALRDQMAKLQLFYSLLGVEVEIVGAHRPLLVDLAKLPAGYALTPPWRVVQVSRERTQYWLLQFGAIGHASWYLRRPTKSSGFADVQALQYVRPYRPIDWERTSARSPTGAEAATLFEYLEVPSVVRSLSSALPAWTVDDLAACRILVRECCGQLNSRRRLSAARRVVGKVLHSRRREEETDVGGSLNSTWYKFSSLSVRPETLVVRNIAAIVNEWIEHVSQLIPLSSQGAVHARFAVGEAVILGSAAAHVKTRSFDTFRAMASRSMVRYLLALWAATESRLIASPATLMEHVESPGLRDFFSAHEQSHGSYDWPSVTVSLPVF